MPASSEFEVKESLLVKQRDGGKATPQAVQPLPSGIYFLYCGSFNQWVGLLIRERNIQNFGEEGVETSRRSSIGHCVTFYGLSISDHGGVGCAF